MGAIPDGRRVNIIYTVESNVLGTIQKTKRATVDEHSGDSITWYDGEYGGTATEGGDITHEKYGTIGTNCLVNVFPEPEQLCDGSPNGEP